MVTSEVHYWGDLNDSLLNFRSDSPGYIIVNQEDHVARIQIVISWMILASCTLQSKILSEINVMAICITK